MLAKLLLALDAAMPEVRKAMDDLAEGVKAADMKKKARRKAEEIEKVTVRQLLDTTLDPMDIVARFRISDDVIHLTLTKTQKADLDIPMERLREFLSDPDRIESVLVPQKDAEKFGEFDFSM
jgi:BMFP domain-containing protein YqiC